VILAAVCTELLLRLLDSVGVFEVVAMVVAALAVGRPPLPLRLRRLRLHTTAMPSFNLATAVALSCQPSAHIHMHAAIHKSHIQLYDLAQSHQQQTVSRPTHQIFPADC
jgi:hypothetical protein